MKLRDKIKDTELESQLNIIVSQAKKTDFRDMGKNDFYHSKNVEEIIDKLIPDEVIDNDKYITQGEAFLLLVAIYLHDIGRKVNPNYHELTSYDLIESDFLSYGLQNKFVAKAVAQICRAHAPEKDWPIMNTDPKYGITGLDNSERTYNLRNLGALLRLGDELDNTFTRVQGIESQKQSIRNIIRYINPRQRFNDIEFQVEASTWTERAVIDNIKEYTQSRLDEVKDILKDMGIVYSKIWVNHTTPTPKLDYSKEEYASSELVEKVGLLVNMEYNEVAYYKSIGTCIMSVYCVKNLIGFSVTTGIQVINELTKDVAIEYKVSLLYHLQNGDLSTAAIVVGKYPDKEILDIFAKTNIAIIEYNDLFRNTINFEKEVTEWTKWYEDKDIYKKKLYIPLRIENEFNDDIGQLDSYVDKWLSLKERYQLTILGEYGTGKTTFSEYLTYRLMKDYKERKTHRFPILIYLKNLSRGSSIQSEITNHIVNNLGLTLDYQKFEELNKAGCFTIILDGFDEMNAINDNTHVYDAYRELDSLTHTNSKVILTCRTHYFRSLNEFKRIQNTILYDALHKKYGYDIVFITPYKLSQINRYVHKYDPERADQVMENIKNIYNLMDLASRPVLLEMIMSTSHQLANTASGEITTSKLYNLYINQWLRRDDWRSVLSDYERMELAYHLAHFLVEQNTYFVHYKELNKVVKDFSGNTKYTNEVIDQEFRTCNFLKNDTEGNYSFAHESFHEFILAKSLISDLLDPSKKVNSQIHFPSDNKSDANVSKETEFFFFELIIGELKKNGVKKIFNITYKNESKIDLVFRAIDSCDSKEKFDFCSIAIRSSSGKKLGRLIDKILSRKKYNEIFLAIFNDIVNNDEKENATQIYNYIYDSKVKLSIREKYLKYNNSNQKEEKAKAPFNLTNTLEKVNKNYYLAEAANKLGFYKSYPKGFEKKFDAFWNELYEVNKKSGSCVYTAIDAMELIIDEYCNYLDEEGHN